MTQSLNNMKSEAKGRLEKKFCFPEREDGTPLTWRLSANPSSVLTAFDQELDTLAGKVREESIKRALEIVNGIKNSTGENAPREWFDALHCVRHSLEALLSPKEE